MNSDKDSHPKVKVCGITENKGLESACCHGADFIGFLFYPASPHYVDLKTAKQLISDIPPNIKSVGLFVNPADQDIDQVINHTRIDMIQLHGDESPERVAEIKKMSGLEVIKAIQVKAREALRQAPEFRDSADWLIFDSGGGSGQTFNWDFLLDYKNPGKKWMLAGGLNTGNVKQAIDKLNPPALDISSGLESSRGIKDPEKIKAFLKMVKQAD